MSNHPQVFMTPAQVCARWNGQIKTSTLANWRCNKKGPPFAKINGVIMYPVKELEAWEAAQIQNTQDHPANDNLPDESENNDS